MAQIKALKLYCTFPMVSKHGILLILHIEVYFFYINSYVPNLANCYRKDTQDHGLDEEVVNVLCQINDATP